VGPRAGLHVCEKSRPHLDSIPGPSRFPIRHILKFFLFACFLHAVLLTPNPRSWRIASEHITIWAWENWLLIDMWNSDMIIRQLQALNTVLYVWMVLYKFVARCL
jgi:hypothetical protein